MAEYFNVYFLEKVYGGILCHHTGSICGSSCADDEPDSIYGRRGCKENGMRSYLLSSVLFLMNGFIYMTVGETHKNWLLLLIYIVLYAGIRSKYRYSTRVIMGSVFYSAAFLNIVISEPWGDLISALGFRHMDIWESQQSSIFCCLYLWDGI